MIKKFQKIKIVIIFLIFFGSTFFSISSVVKSGPLDQIYECTPYIVIDYDRSLLQEPIIPFEKAKTIPLNVKLQLLGPSVDIVLAKISGTEFIVDMSITEVPDGCQASVTPPILLIPLPKENTIVSVNATISITINQYLPVRSQENVAVRMNSRRLGQIATLIKPGNFTQDIPFVVGYYSQLSFNYIDGNVRNISPDETADFNFKIQNWGNGATKVISEVVDIPDGWTSEIVYSTILGSELIGNFSDKSISLRVKPPVDFGYHEDRAIIKVSMTPISIENPDYRGEPHYLYFIVQSKGFFTPGFEFSIMLFAFIFILFPILKKKSKIKEGGEK
ncbi:MAG: hypothetical protein AYK22_06155 [Thermoplasmatales archaeon SG8-52-3]|nr:MAG: hypothetical protein AYK22_06155 [Thermoplasmatales archaeon SG8-52-3]